MSAVIKIENLSKQYRLGLVSTRTLSHDFNRWWQINIRGREDPYLKVGEANDRTTKGYSEYVWALRDINLEIHEGEVLGIIGTNGAGKSTLLKILSKVTAPTTGVVKARGRIASLLEVGTGFHQEMTGRENIYMNGAIMGMTKAEIKRKFDEIVDFAGVERYIDTPVKRYSSGMTVRLGFAIAAHLEPEILVVDEVLAVGDAEFQNKAVGKMKEVSSNMGRTVLFVSHNMSAILNLCPDTLLLKDGKIEALGLSADIVNQYLSVLESGKRYLTEDLNKELYIKEASVEINDYVIVSIVVSVISSSELSCSIDFRFKTKSGIPVGFASCGTFNANDMLWIKRGLNKFCFKFSADNWALGKYFISLDLTQPDVTYYERLEDILMFEVVRKPNNDWRALNLEWNYGPYQIAIHKCHGQQDY
jgi:lipopolysaccharide transport system ATP-binding protein